MAPLRSMLFAPGNHARKVEKVFTIGADAVILDLEDAVAVSEKVATRATVVDALKKPRTCQGYVRVNSINTEFCYGDLRAVIGDGLDGIVFPMIELPNELQTIDWVITEIERERGLTLGAIDLIPIIETGKGVYHIDAIAAAGTRVKRVAFGAGDYTRDMNLVWTGEERELLDARARIVLASRVAGIEAPLDSVFINLRDREHLEGSTRAALELGFQGKCCIHPDQVALTNEVFTPTDDEVARAERIIAAFREAEAAGSASIQVDGGFVDYPIVEKAQRTLDLMARIRAAA